MLWRVLYGSQRGLIGVHSAFRSARGSAPGSGRLEGHRTAFFAYPGRARAAAGWCLGASEEGLEAYFCAHLLTGSRRTKEYAAPVLALWADADGAPVPPGAPEPTAVVESSPGHAHLFWRLRRPVSPQQAEELNRRLIVAVGADRSGLGSNPAPQAPGHPQPQVRRRPGRRADRAGRGTRLPPARAGASVTPDAAPHGHLPGRALQAR